MLFIPGIGMVMTFCVTMYISNQLKAHVKAVKGATFDQLPPLPDPNIFSRPVHSSPAQAVAENWQGR